MKRSTKYKKANVCLLERKVLRNILRIFLKMVLAIFNFLFAFLYSYSCFQFFIELLTVKHTYTQHTIKTIVRATLYKCFFSLYMQQPIQDRLQYITIDYIPCQFLDVNFL